MRKIAQDVAAVAGQNVKMKQEVLINRGEEKTAEQELMSEFLFSVILQCGVPIEEFSNKKEMTPKEMQEFRKILEQFNVEIIYYGDCSKIFVEDECIGIWNKPKFTLKKDFANKNPAKRIYVSIETDTWSIFDAEDIDKQEEDG